MSAEEMAKARQEAHSLGLVMGKDRLNASNNFKVGVESLKAQVAAVGMELTVRLMPILNDSLVPLIQTAVIPTIRLAIEAAGALANAFSAMPTIVQQVIIALKRFNVRAVFIATKT
jgi:hypothetical protein